VKKSILSTIVLGALAAGCATGKVVEVRTPLAPDAVAKDKTIYIKTFDASKAEFQGDYSDVAGNIDKERVRVPDIIGVELIARLKERGLKAEKYAPGVPADALVVDGRVTLVDSGSGAARFWIGMGAGASSVFADVKVVREGKPDAPLCDLKMAGHSGGTGGIYGYQDWIGANAKDLAITMADYIAGDR
jgi:hypothetical protein